MEKTMDTREKIFHTALEEFAANGYKHTTIRAISKKADVNVAAVNYHFGGKAGLYASVFEYLFYPTEKLSVKNRGRITDEESARECLRNWISEYIGVQNESDFGRQKRKILLYELSEPSEAFEVLVDKYIKPNFAPLFDCFRLCLPQGSSEVEVQIHCLLMVAKCAFFLTYKHFINSLMGKNFARDNIDTITGMIIKETFTALK